MRSGASFLLLPLDSLEWRLETNCIHDVLVVLTTGLVYCLKQARLLLDLFAWAPLQRIAVFELMNLIPNLHELLRGGIHVLNDLP